MQRKGRIRWFIILVCFWGDLTFSLIMGMIFSSIDPTIGRNGYFQSPAGITSWFLGLLSTVVAGYFAGYFAKEERFLHGFLVGGLGILLSLYLTASGVTFSLGDLLLPLLAAPLAGLAGYASRWTPERQRRRGKK